MTGWKPHSSHLTEISNENFASGTNFVTKQLATGVGMAENLIGNTSKTIHQKIVPNPEPVKIPRGVQMTARGLRSTSEVAVKASGFVGMQSTAFSSQTWFLASSEHDRKYDDGISTNVCAQFRQEQKDCAAGWNSLQTEDERSQGHWARGLHQ